LEATFDRELITDRWAAVETAYALATKYRDAGDVDAARKWLRILRDLLAQFPSDTLEQTATRRMSVAGVMIPEHLHDGVVVARFEGLLREP
jgi:hypothetical protein